VEMSEIASASRGDDGAWAVAGAANGGIAWSAPTAGARARARTRDGANRTPHQHDLPMDAGAAGRFFVRYGLGSVGSDRAGGVAPEL
jgi:hypothetical protein